jgi:hypothetical protein
MRRNILSVFCLTIAAALSVRAETIVALTSGNRLLFFDSATPGTITKVVTVTGLASGQTLVGLDFRPWIDVLYALGSPLQIYSINAETGLAHPFYYLVPFVLNGTRFGFDFNPTVPTANPLFDGDMIRVTSNTGQNLRLHPLVSSFSFTDMNLHYAAADPNAAASPNVVGSAYTNNFSGSGATVLYDIDSNLDILAIQNPPNTGTLHTVGPLGVDTTDNVGFDVSGSTGVAFASLTVGAVTSLYTRSI